MYKVTRKAEDKPDGELRIQIDAPAPEDMKDPPFGLGGTFYWKPGESQMLQEHSARVVMSDPGLRERFTVDPPLPVVEAEPPADELVVDEAHAIAAAAADEPDTAPPAQQATPVPMPPVIPEGVPKPAPAVRAKK